MGGIPAIAREHMAEAVGTALLANGIIFCATANPTYAALGIAITLAVAIYAVGRVSGAHLNPAVTVALVATKKAPIMKLTYIPMQCVGAVGGMMMHVMYYNSDADGMPHADGALNLARLALGPGMDNLNPTGAVPFTDMQAMTVEMLYTFMLCFTVLCCAAAESAQGNSYFGMAIGFVILAGGYGGGAVSGGVFNPAIATSIEFFGIGDSTFGSTFIKYISAEFVGAILAAIMFRLVHPEDYGGSNGILEGDKAVMMAKVMSEFIGTFMLVSTIGLAVSNGAAVPSLCIGGTLIVMVYSLASVSGANLNPCVTIGLMARKALSPKDGAIYIATQMIAGGCAGIFYTGLMGDARPILATMVADGQTASMTMSMMMYSEALFTMFLVFIVISTTTSGSEASWTTNFVGFTVGSALVASVACCGHLSGSAINPAVAFGINFGYMMGAAEGQPDLSMEFPMYMAAEAMGAVGAVLLFAVVYNEEYAGANMATEIKPAATVASESTAGTESSEGASTDSE